MAVDDPRDASNETAITLPKSWRQQDSDFAGSASMMFSGATMLTRNRFMGWGALLLAVASLSNQKPMRTKESSTGGPLSAILFACATLVTSYIPMLIVNPAAQKTTSVPLSTETPATVA
ncbi:hypothetical protein CALCODRAFT_492966 [Calocera cornea HHB12733]|uniref:Uncharacterized protein n=1 Tax=Calocera cornea HHB12733 TaxID=1353952 RepID=A0A165I0N9_9BASI|nr:hypothetical protein CALCODRAFT_492966 [Calocera cornea HHB12733]